MKLIKTTKNFLFPVHCLGCNKKGDYLCPDCLNKITLISHNFCPKCLKISSNGRLCPNCKNSSFPVEKIIISLYYSNPLVAELIKKYKFFPFAYELAKPLGLLLSKAIKETNALSYLQKENFKIIPVPLTKKDKAKRGFNQTYELAKIVSHELNLPISENTIFKIKTTKPQVGLNAQQRKNNLKNAFQVKKNLNQENFLIIDDIITTGSTVYQVAKTLKNKGANQIWAAILAKG